MKKHNNSIIFIFTALILLTGSFVKANQIVYLDAFQMFADKSTLQIEIGKYQGRFAMKLNFGYGLAAKNVGLTYKEVVHEKNLAKFEAALMKLNEILNDPKINLLRIEKELSKDIGLSFDAAVSYGEIK